MKNLSKNEMNAVKGGCWPKSWKISACAGGPADTVDIDDGCTPT